MKTFGELVSFLSRKQDEAAAQRCERWTMEDRRKIPINQIEL